MTSPCLSPPQEESLPESTFHLSDCWGPDESMTLNFHAAEGEACSSRPWGPEPPGSRLRGGAGAGNRAGSPWVLGDARAGSRWALTEGLEKGGVVHPTE